MELVNESIVHNELLEEHNIRNASIRLAAGRHHTVLVDAEEGDVSVRLPEAAKSVNVFVTIYARLVGTNLEVSIIANGRDNIYNSAGDNDSLVLDDTDAGIVLFCDGLAWYDISSTV